MDDRPPLPAPITKADQYLHDMAASLRGLLDRDGPKEIHVYGSAATDLTEPAGRFDPAEHTVAQVNDYLADVDETERDRVLAAEKAGKARTSIRGM